MEKFYVKCPLLITSAKERSSPTSNLNSVGNRQHQSPPHNIRTHSRSFSKSSNEIWYLVSSRWQSLHKMSGEHKTLSLKVEQEYYRVPIQTLSLWPRPRVFPPVFCMKKWREVPSGEHSENRRDQRLPTVMYWSPHYVTSESPVPSNSFSLGGVS